MFAEEGLGFMDFCVSDGESYGGKQFEISLVIGVWMHFDIDDWLYVFMNQFFEMECDGFVIFA